ncbi:hypothetical protein PINS_up014183 [Pythium insidiosum]|nr:hypothetical protein PINS_up014183 [Pythium insidiosum]
MTKHQLLLLALLLALVTRLAPSAAQTPPPSAQCTLVLPGGNAGNASTPCSPNFIINDGNQVVLEVESSGVIDIRGGTGENVKSIVIQGNDNARPQLQLTSNPFKAYTKLYALTFKHCNFRNRSVSLAVSNQLNYLQLENTNAEDISIASSETIWEKLELSIPGTSLTRLPRLVYEREFRNLTIRNLTFADNVSSHQLTEVEFKNARDNLKEAKVPNVVVNEDCNASREANQLLVCKSSAAVPTPAKSFEPKEGMKSDAAPKENASTPTTTRSSGSSSSTTLVVLVPRDVRVHLQMLMASSTSCATTTMVPCGRTESFISSDPTLRAFRIEPSEVTVTKSIGAGPFWLGQYAGAKVFINRVEAVNHDSHTTKALRAHAQSLTTIQHRNIVSMIGVTWIDSADFGVVAEFMAKGSLKSVLTDNHTTLDQLARITMCLEVANALAYLHSSACDKHMRRLSTRKVLVSDTLQCKLNLFECVPVTTALHAPQVVGAGELAWFAPEVVMESSKSDARMANIFALGVLLCEVLTNTTPYEAEIEELGFVQADLQLLKRIKTKQPLVPHENHPVYLGLSSDLRHLIERCLSYTLADRPTALEVVDCLERCKATLESRAFL